MPIDLTPERGLLFRITHLANLPWLLAHGLHAANSTQQDPTFVSVGNPDLISKRIQRQVPIPPHGTLADYVPFYFTPKSPMLYNIQTGWNGITQRSNEEIIILFSSWQTMTKHGVSMIFSDRHAYTAMAAYSSRRDELARMIDWNILSRHDFRADDGYPDKKERYQAEGLAYRFVPPSALLGIGCVSEAVKLAIEMQVRTADSSLAVFVRRGWYF